MNLLGTRERVIPDYLFGLRSNKVEIVIEAKFRYIEATEKEQKRHFQQANSYALHFQAKKLLIADKDGIIFFNNTLGEFERDKYELFKWSELRNNDKFQKLKILIK